MSEDLKRITIRFPEEDHHKLKMLAAYKNMTMIDIIVECINEQFESLGLTLPGGKNNGEKNREENKKQ